MDAGPQKTSRKWWWLAGTVTVCVVLGLAVAAVFFAVGRKIWTDDRDIRRKDSESKVRQVLWAPAEALDESFNTPNQEYEPSASADGDALYFVRGLPQKGADIYVSYRRVGRWTPPAPVEGINTKHDELGPRLTPDGRFLMFYSNRPGGEGQYDIWAAEKTEDGWGKPFNLGPNVNSKWNEYGPAMDPAGKRLYIATNRKAAARRAEKNSWRATIRQGEIGDYDLFVAEVKRPVEIKPAAPTTAPAEAEPRLPIIVPPETQPVAKAERSLESLWDDFLHYIKIAQAEAALSHGQKIIESNPKPSEVYRLSIEYADSLTVIARGARLNGLKDTCQKIRKLIEEGYHELRADTDEIARSIEMLGGTVRQFELATTQLVFHDAKELKGVNTLHHEGAGCISPGGDFLYFASNRPGGSGGFDLYRCRLRAGRCGEVENLGPEVNTARNETDPQLAMGGFLIYFSSDRTGSRGGYDLWVSQSHEVYATRDRRPLPSLGWHWWALLIALAALIPLLLWLRAAEYRHLSLLQKCIVASLLLHIGLTIVLSLFKISQEFIEYIAREGGMTTKVNLELAREVEVKMQVRHQITDLPVADRSLTDLDRVVPTVLQRKAPAPAEVNVPRSQIRPVPATVQPEAPRRLPPEPSERVSLPPPRVFADAPQIRIEPTQPIVAAEERPAPVRARARPTRMRPVVAPRPIQEPVFVAAAPARPEAEPLPQAAKTPRPITPVAEKVRIEAKVPTQPPLRPAPQEVAAPRVRAAEPRRPTVAAGAATSARRETPAPRAAQQDVKVAAAPARPAPESLVEPVRADRAAPPVTENVRTEMHVPPPADLKPAPTEILASPVRTREPEGPAVTVGSVTAAKRATGPPRPDQQDVKVAAAPARPDVRSVVEPVRAKPRAVPVTEPVRTEAPAAPQPDLKPAPADVAARRVRADEPEGPAVAVGSVTATKRTTGPSRPGQQDVKVAAAPARPQAKSLVEVARAKPPVVAVTETVRTEAPMPAPADLKPAPEDLSTAPVRTIKTEGPVVVARAAPSGKRATASPRTEPRASDVAVPSTTVIPGSRVVAASATPRPHRHAPKVAVNIPALTDAPRIQLPVAAAKPEAAAETPPEATGLQDARPLRRRTVSAVRQDRPDRPMAPRERPAAAEPDKDSLADRMASATPRPWPPDIVRDRIGPKALPIPLTTPLGPDRLTAPRTFFHRSFEQRDRLLKEMGGSEETEKHVARALVFLAANQEPDGRWSSFSHRRRSRGQRSDVDVALTGLGALCFLAADHTPAKPGPYQSVSTKALDALLRIQRPNGDLRGRGRMYGHAIATLALAEAAAMTADPAYRQAAIKAGEFILKAQNRNTGGWRYDPGQPGDTSVFGWQVMALHSVERLGRKIPDRTRKGARRWLAHVSRSRHRMIAGYQNSSPRPAMTAEALLSHILLGKRLTEAEMKEAGDYLLKSPPGRGKANFYYWYYASLALAQLRNEAWDQWNVQMKKVLTKLQKRGGDLDGSWDPNTQWGSRGGRIYTTALATLMLEVYYRYLPMYGGPGPPKE